MWNGEGREFLACILLQLFVIKLKKDFEAEVDESALTTLSKRMEAARNCKYNKI